METNIEPGLKPEETKQKPILVFVVVALVIAAAIFGYLKMTPKITGLEVAIKTATFLDKTLQPNGSMIGGYKCNQLNSECMPMPLSAEQPHTGQAIYGYYILAKASGDLSYREKADRAINFVLDSCDTDVRMCEWNFFPLVQYYQDTKEEKYLTRGMLRPAEKFLAMPIEDAISQNVGHKLASLFEATGDERYKHRLLEIADGELKNWPLPKSRFEHSIQIIWSVFVPSYRITQDSKYLVASEQFFDNFNVVESLDQFQSVDGINKGVDALLSMDQVSQKKDFYKSQAHSVLQGVLVDLWDTPQNPKFTGDYGFLGVKITPEIKPTDEIGKPTLFNGWLIKMFVLMKDEKFKVPKTIN